MRPADLDPGRYVLVEVDHESTGFEIGSMVDSLRIKDEIVEGVYPQGTLILEVMTGDIYRVEMVLEPVAFEKLQVRQQERANRYRDDWWPNPEERPRPKRRALVAQPRHR